MRARRVILNSALGLALVGVGFLAVTSVGSARSATPVGQTAKVTRGTLVASVTATGNVLASTRVQVDLTGSGGRVTAIYVKAGQHVTKGQRLLKVDDTSARESLKTARASLASAKAQLTTTTQGRSAQETSQDRASVASAEQSVENAETSLGAAKASLTLDRRQQNGAVRDAEDALSAAKHRLSQGKDDLAAVNRQLATDRAAGDASAVTTDQSQVSSLTSAVSSATSAVTSAESALTQARRTRASTVLKDEQAVDSQSGALATARKQLSVQQATAATNAQPAREGALESAQAQIDSAEVTVSQAKKTLADTVLRAPTAATVASINAVKGQSSGSSGSSASSGSSGSGSGGSSGTGSSTSGTSSTASASASSSGLVVLDDLLHKQVSATVAEADVTKLRLGQHAVVVFAASNVSASGTVTAIDTEQTVTNNVVEYGVTVRLDSHASEVRIGQTANLTITTAEKTGVLIVPTGALRTAGGRSTVSRRQGNVDFPVEVQTGLVGTTGTEVTSGLAEGDDVVLPGTGGS